MLSAIYGTMYDMSMNPDDTLKWIPSVKTFSARLALVRHGMGWNISEAAEAAGLPEANWREWELNGRTPRNIAEVSLQISAAARAVDDYWLSTGRQNGIFPDRPGGPVTGRYQFPRNIRTSDRSVITLATAGQSRPVAA